MTSPPNADDVLALVHQGWDHLRLQRPLAAWASWQQALRLSPEDRAAREALAVLDAAEDLPAAARASYRFRGPRDESGRARWDARFRGADLTDLGRAAAAFEALTHDDPEDADAWLNLALCRAWLGENAPAVEALGRAVALEAGRDAETAAGAWALAEILRQGAGAESLADDLSHTLAIPRAPDDPDPAASGPLRPVGPVGTADETIRAYEWLDRPLPEPSAGLTVADLPRVLASLVVTSQAYRLSSPDPRGLAAAEEALSAALGDPDRPARREATPLPLPLMDAAAWSVRLPPGLDDEARHRLTRGAVEHVFEDLWIHVPRHGLDGRTPREAARDAAVGDAVARAKLEGILRLREQLGARPRAAGLYLGYPFDRLRRRLGLEVLDPGALDASDLSCASGPELDRLDPAALVALRLAEAAVSAAGLGDDARTARFAAAGLLHDPPLALPPGPVAALVRQSLAEDGPSRALDWLDRALRADAAAGGRHGPAFAAWRAEVAATGAGGSRTIDG